jgi:hypothetical protein
MASSLYNKAKNLFLTSGIDISAGGTDVRVVMIDTTGYTFAATHAFLSDIPAAGRIPAGNDASKVGLTLANKAVSATGQFSADSVTFTAVSPQAGIDSLNAVVIYRRVTSDADSPLIAYIDQGTGLPVTLNGSDITIVWGSYIFAL